MPGRKLVLDTPFTGTGQPILPTLDPIESLGSLMLTEPMHPAGAWGAGVPANGAFMPNVLAARAATIAGAANTAANTGAKVYRVGGSTLVDGTALLERSSKGGLHAALDPTETVQATLAFALFMADPIWTFLRANVSHNIYWSLWHRITRPAAPTNGARTAWMAPAAYALVEHDRTSNAALGSRPATNVAGPELRNAAAPTANSGSLGANSQQATNLFAGANGGLTYNQSSADKLNKMGSHIFYRAYVEDLTLSGRSYAAVDAIDNALYTKEVLTAGGRYYGDTFTDPVTAFA